MIRVPRGGRADPQAAPRVAIATRRALASLADQALEVRGAFSYVVEPVDEDSSPTTRLVALLATRQGGGSRAFGLLDPTGLNPDEARLLAAEAARAGKTVVVLAPAPEGRARRAHPESWPLPERIAWRGFLAGLGLVPASDLAAFIEALLHLAEAPLPRGPRVSFQPVQPSAGLVPQEACESLLLVQGGRRGSDVQLRVPPLEAPIEELLRLGDQLRAIGAMARTLPPGLPPPSSKEAQDRARFILDRAGRVPSEHDAMLLLASYGIHVSRQAVAHSASAAAGIADKIGYPVDVRSAIGGLAAEEQGAPVVSQVANAPGVRRAYTTVNFDQERLTGKAWEAALVRERPPHGPRIRASVYRHSRLGWLATVAAPPLCGEPRPALAATSLPLSQRAAQRFSASPELQSLFPSGRFAVAAAAGLADILMRLSRLVLDHEERLEEVAIEQLVCTVQRRAIAFEARIIRRW